MFSSRSSELLGPALPPYPPSSQGTAGPKQTPGHTMSGPRKEAQVHSFSLHPQRATSAQSEPNYRAVGRAVPTGSQQRAVANTRKKLLSWHPSLSLLSSTTREEGLTPQSAAGSHRSSTGQTRPLSSGTKPHSAWPCTREGSPPLPRSCSSAAYPPTAHQGLLLTRGFPHPSHQAFGACGAAVPV